MLYAIYVKVTDHPLGTCPAREELLGTPSGGVWVTSDALEARSKAANTFGVDCLSDQGTKGGRCIRARVYKLMGQFPN